jgi:hypothetical protein
MRIHRSTRSRALAIATSVVALIAITAGPVAADTAPPGDATYSQNGSVARVALGTCLFDEDVVSCTTSFVEIFNGKLSDDISGITHANQLCVDIERQSFSWSTGEPIGEPTFEHGCAVDLPSGVIRFDSKLAWATLESTTVTVEQLVCDKIECVPGPSREITVDGTWTGDGPVMTSKAKSTFGDGQCRYDNSVKASERFASFSGSITGMELEGHYEGSLLTGRFSFRSRCSEL